jgi:hypothetical protein
MTPPVARCKVISVGICMAVHAMAGTTRLETCLASMHTYMELLHATLF